MGTPELHVEVQDPTTGGTQDLTGLFICMRCHTMEELPNYVPAEADFDPRIPALIATHVRRHPSVEDRLITEWAVLGSVPTKAWGDAEYRKQIKAKIMEGTGQTGFDAEAYAIRDTFREDAGHCYNEHKRPTFTGVKCLDYKSYNKEIKPDTRAERKELGMPAYGQGDTKLRKMFLCDYCPYHASVATELTARSLK